MASTMMQIGNSIGVIVPAEIRKKAKLSKGSKVDFEVNSDGNVVMSKSGSKKKSSITPEFTKWLNAFNKEYGSALEELAKK